MLCLLSGGVADGGVYYLSRLSEGGVAVEAEQLVWVLLSQAHLGEHAPGAGPASGGGVEQHGVLDAGELAEQFADG